MRSAAMVVLGVLGCGGDEALTCELLADPDNCWASAAAEATACLTSRATPGTMSADRASCAWPDGTRVDFDAPLPRDIVDLERLGFDVTGNGCSWRFEDFFANHMELTVEGRRISATLRGNTFELACDDGTSYTSSFDLLFTCQPPARAPTDGFDIDPQTGAFSFTISAVDAPIPIFTCR